MRKRIGTALLFAGIGGAALAEEESLSGTVADETGGTLPGVTVEASGDSLVSPRLEVTDRDGAYQFTGLPPGDYVVVFTLGGFERLERQVMVIAGTPATLDAELRLGGLFEQVNVTVTGSAIESPAINMPSPVTVVSREILEQQGNTQLVDVFRNLNVSHGVAGERSSWYNSNQPATLTESVANVNLRGLGASRTLVLLNGRRHAPVPARLIGGRFVDVNTIPSIAVGRLEVLKEGGSATYGSDAVGGVANFVTRSDFRGFEFKVGHDWFEGAGDTTFAGIWGAGIGASNLVVAMETVGREELMLEERPWTLARMTDYPPGSRVGWSSLGNPGTFSVGEPVPWTADVFDPRCSDFGGLDEGWTCRFRYAQYDNVIEEQRHNRFFAELNGPLTDRVDYRIEGLWSDAVIPNWYTTPSYPPFPLTSTTTQEVGADHPGRQAFCSAYAGDPKADPAGACLDDRPWYFNGRPFANSGPARQLRRESRTQRISGSLDGDFALAGRDLHWDTGLTFSRAEGNYNLPAVYSDRLFLAYRGFGGPGCGVGVVADPDSSAGMRLGPLNGAVAGRGPCSYYNPFSNAIQFSEQHRSALRDTPNPDYLAELRNTEELRLWLNDESDLVSTVDLFVADFTLSGPLVENLADFALGYQFRNTNAAGNPNDSGDVTINPCPVTGDTSCDEGRRFGPFAFTNVHRPYSASQRVQRFFAELAFQLGSRIDTQLAANYEFYDVEGRRVNSFDPKFGWRFQAFENLDYSLSFRGSVQTTFRTPSLDDLNTSPFTTLEWIPETGAYQAVDRFGRADLLPERAFTYNVGAVLFLGGNLEATVDFWSYDFENVIGSMPYDAVSGLYSGGDPAIQDAVAPFVVCAGGRASDLAPAERCDAQNLKRLQIDLVNWPGLTTTGFDTHLAQRLDIGPGRLSLSWDSTYTRSYDTKELLLPGTSVVLSEAEEAAGYLNFAHPIAVPLPRWKSRWWASWDWGDYRLAGYLNYISSYEDRGENTTVPLIESFTTLDASFRWRLPQGVDLTLYALNLTGAIPPHANVEQAFDGFTHDPKERRLKAALTWRFGGE